METLIINVPEKKSTLVKQILKGLGVIIQDKPFARTDYKDKILKVSVWTEDDLKLFDEAKKSFDSLNPAQW